VKAGYRLVRTFARILLALFYRRIEVVGAARVPTGGPLIVAANHQNALVDPMLLMTSLPRPLVPLAKAPLFRHPLIGPFLFLAGALPVHRRQESGSEPVDNTAMFRSAIAGLEAGGAILVFPEGDSKPEPVLRALRTGTARMLLAAEAARAGTLGVRLVPAALVYHEPGAFRAGRALVIFGEPVAIADCIALYAADPIAAARRLTERLAAELRRVMVEAEDRRTFRLLELLTTMWAEEFSEAARDGAARAAWMQQAMAAYRHLQLAEPARIAAFRSRVERYAKALELAGLRERQVARPPRWGVAWRYALREGLALVLGAPLAAVGILLHVVPYQLTRLAVAALRPGPDEEATYKMAAATVLYPLSWLAEGWLAWRLGGWWAVVAVVLALLPTGFLALGWRERLGRLGRETRGLLVFLFRRDLGRQLAAQRGGLVEEMTALARSMPADVLAGRAGPAP
jgi:glycerol-3-phosphate O-acyltransferase/dihydroxyacetone phosphate acyltransferase